MDQIYAQKFGQDTAFRAAAVHRERRPGRLLLRLLLHLYRLDQLGLAEQPLPVRDPRVVFDRCSASARRRASGGAPRRGSQHPRLAEHVGRAAALTRHRRSRGSATTWTTSARSSGGFRRSRLSTAAANRASCPAPIGVPRLVLRARQLMPDLQALAFASTSRASSRSRWAAASNRTYPSGFNGAFHSSSHRRREDGSSTSRRSRVSRQHDSVFPREAEEHAGRRRHLLKHDGRHGRRWATRTCTITSVSFFVAGHAGALKGGMTSARPSSCSPTRCSARPGLGIETPTFGDSTAALDLNTASAPTRRRSRSDVGRAFRPGPTVKQRAARRVKRRGPSHEGEWPSGRQHERDRKELSMQRDVDSVGRRDRRAVRVCHAARGCREHVGRRCRTGLRQGDGATLLKQAADVNGAQGDGMTALHWAAMKNDPTLAQTLLYASANVKATTRIGGYTPRSRRPAGLRRRDGPLIKAYADANAQDRQRHDAADVPRGVRQQRR